MTAPNKDYRVVLQNLVIAIEAMHSAPCAETANAVEHQLHLAKMLLLYRDGCEMCQGERGGVPGNENRVGIGDRVLVMCDYCTADHFVRIATPRIGGGDI